MLSDMKYQKFKNIIMLFCFIDTDMNVGNIISNELLCIYIYMNMSSIIYNDKNETKILMLYKF